MILDINNEKTITAEQIITTGVEKAEKLLLKASNSKEMDDAKIELEAAKTIRDAFFEIKEISKMESGRNRHQNK